MRFREFGRADAPHILLIHGGGNAWWNYLRQARALAERYHVILPTLDGHGEEWAVDYRSTEHTADLLLQYIDAHCGGQLFALSGVSLGGQIVIELLSRRPNLAKKAIIDGCLCIPQPFLAKLCSATVRLFGGMMFCEKSCRWQLKMMPKLLPPKMLYPQEIQDYYLTDIPRTPLKTLLTIYRTYMAAYALKESVQQTTAQVQYWYGEKEMACVKRSARHFQSLVPSCTLYEAKGYNHGYLSIYLPQEWLALAEPFFAAP